MSDARFSDKPAQRQPEPETAEESKPASRSQTVYGVCPHEPPCEQAERPKRGTSRLVRERDRRGNGAPAGGAWDAVKWGDR